MASGKTIELAQYSRRMFWRAPVAWVQKERDRTLAGKKRVRARKAARRD